MSRKVGRPTDYDPEYNEQARKLCLLGATDEELADFFGVTEQTINNWKIAHPEFFESIKEGKERADSEVASKLFHRACGYSHEAVQIAVDAKTGKDHAVPYIKHYPPDTAAGIFWLKNRRKKDWREKVTVGGDSEEPIEVLVRRTVISADAED